MDNDWFGCEPEGMNRHGEVPHPEMRVYLNAFKIKLLNGDDPRLALRATIRQAPGIGEKALSEWDPTGGTRTGEHACRCRPERPLPGKVRL